MYRPLLTTLLLLLLNTAWGQVSTNIHQLIALDDPERELASMNLRIHGDEDNVKIVRIKGTRLQVKTRVTISYKNEHFINYLAKTGRYELETVPNSSSVNIEAKVGREIILKGEKCTEEIFYTFYIPDYIKNIRITNIDGEFQ